MTQSHFPKNKTNKEGWKWSKKVEEGVKETPPLAFDSTGNSFIGAATRASEFI